MVAVLIGIAALAIALSIYLAVQAIREWLRCRDVVRRSALEQQLQVRRATNELSGLAWKARQQLYGLAEDMRTSSSTLTNRGTRTHYYK